MDSDLRISWMAHPPAEPSDGRFSIECVAEAVAIISIISGAAVAITEVRALVGVVTPEPR